MSCISYGTKERVLVVISILLISARSLLAAGSGSIRGKVMDRETREPLPGATVMIKGTSLGAASNLNGEYMIPVAPVGNQTLAISYVGYVSTTVEVAVLENREVAKDILLEPTTITGQAVTVTAQAQGQLGAINQQLSSNTIENVVSKARIRELPDVNAAESIGRLPGVSIQRSGGEATKIEIRGLDPKYSIVTVNGVNLPATSTTDRSVDLSLISSNMLDGIVLKKVVTPDMDADVLGGTVDLKLREAPEELQFNVSGQGGYNQLQKYYGNYNLNATISNRFFDKHLGIIAGGNIDNYDRSADKLQDSYVPWTATGGIATFELQLREEKVNKKRNGASLLMDYVIPNGKITANGFFNQLTSDGLYHLNIIWTPAGQYNTNRHWYQLEQNKTTTNVFTSAIGAKQDFGWIRYDISAARSGSHLDNPNDRVWQFDQENKAMNDSLYKETDSPAKIASETVIDTSNTLLAYMYIYGTRLTENQTSTQANFEVPFRLSDQLAGYIKAGGKFRWINRTNDQSQVGNGGLQYGNSSLGINNAIAYLDQQYPAWDLATITKYYNGLPVTPFLINYTRSNFLNGDYPIGLVYDQGKMNKMTDALMNAPDSLRVWGTYSIGSYGYDYDGIEQYQAGYLMGQFDLGGYVTLLPGVRWEGEYTKYHGERYQQIQAGQGVDAPPSDFVRLTTERRNSFWLPMVNLILRPTDWLQVRLARTQTLARPDFIQYAPITYTDAQNSYIQAANPGLKPSRSTNYDAAVSVFNNTIGLFSVSGFYKDVKDLIFYSTYSLKGGIQPDSTLDIPPAWYATSAPRINTYQNNPHPATYYGFEIEWQTNFWYLPSVLHGLVLDVNYTHIFSQMELAYDSLLTTRQGYHTIYTLVPRTVKTRMPDQPADIVNFTLGYDLGGFSARLSYLYQTDKLTGLGYDQTVPSTLLSTYTGLYARWDLTLQQKFLQKFVIFANFNNLNNRPDQNFTGSTLTDPSYIEYYGFTMDLGIRFML